jgi:hypothetical protein
VLNLTPSVNSKDVFAPGMRGSGSITYEIEWSQNLSAPTPESGALAAKCTLVMFIFTLALKEAVVLKNCDLLPCKERHLLSWSCVSSA